MLTEDIHIDFPLEMRLDNVQTVDENVLGWYVVNDSFRLEQESEEDELEYLEGAGVELIEEF